MSGFIERLRAAMRAFKLGAGVVETWEPRYGHDDATYSPAEYGDYIATSNAVYACATLRADMLASIPLKAFRLRGGKKKEVVEGPVPELLRKVNDFWTMNRLIEMTELSLCLWGKCFWAVERGANGRGDPWEIWWMKPDQVTIYPDRVNYVRGFSYAPSSGEEEIWFDPKEVIWMRFPNPLDEFAGLSPLAAARLAADLSSAAQKTNKRLYEQGYMAGGVVMPKGGGIWTPNQAEELEKALDQRFKGQDKAHRWGVMRQEVEIKAGAFVSPKDAEFLGSLAWSLEEVARAYKVPLDMIGGQRTYENVQAAERAFWFRTMEPESRFIASELVEQFLPMFARAGVDLIEFDLSRVPILQDAESERWLRANEQIQRGAVTINEWRNSEGLEPVKWGDVWWGPMGVWPVSDAEKTTDGAPNDALGSGLSGLSEEEGELAGAWRVRGWEGVEMGGETHKRLWRVWERGVKRWEKIMGERVRELFERQRESVLAKLKGRAVRTEEEAEEEPFDVARWEREFRLVMKEILYGLLKEMGQEALDRFAIDFMFDVDRPEVRRFLEARAQRFAEEVNETTWKALQESLSQGIQDGEELPKLEERVREVMGDRIRSSEEVIARTEVIGASNGGSLMAWEQSGVVSKKAWLSALLPGRTRETHYEAHERYNSFPIGLEEDFEVGAGVGPHPGAMGVAEEDINCLCTMVPVVTTD